MRQLTDVPARLYGLRGPRPPRRRLAAPTWWCSIRTTVASGPVHMRTTCPAGAGRLYADAIGIEHVFVNGAEIMRDGKHTGARPGTVLRSGRDTVTVEVPGGRADLEESSWSASISS